MMAGNNLNLFNESLFSGALSLGQLTAAISHAVYSSPALSGVWVTAELSDLRINGGHCYIELIEKNQMGQTVAKLRATIWQSTFTGIRRKFYEATGRDIVTGLKVLLKGNVTHHSLYGLSFNVSDIDPSFTLGDMERLRREILMRLTREGIIEHNKALSMNMAPQRIAIISAEGAAGYGDFINQLEYNAEGYVFYTRLFPAIMQGDRVSSSIREALEIIESTIDLWDCVVIIRGGGATTDLNGFDDYELAKAVALCCLPVVVGIGHERDRTVLDEIAHTRLKTPTAVAAFFVDTLRDSEKRAEAATDRIVHYVSDRIAGENQRLANFTSLIPALTDSRLKMAAAWLEREAAKIPLIVESRLTREKSRIDETFMRIKLGLEKRIALSKNNLDKLESMINVLSPLNTLKRGYSITRINGKAVKDRSSLKIGDIVTTELFDCKMDAEIKEIKGREN